MKRPTKKLIYMVWFLAVLFMVTACGNNKEQENPDKEPEISIVSSEQPDSEFAEAQKPETKSDRENSQQEETEQEETEMKMKVQVGDTIFTATLAENSSVDALKELMADGPLTLNMSDYASMEKGADLGVTLPQNNEQMDAQPGDIILYQGRTFVIYYDTNSWSLTPIGKIDNVDAEELREVLGTGNVTVTLSVE
ncbi:MAG: hypothetical protein K2N81_10300 [Acetatifactor sp.]|nr:hypothetical protein [Acetatifactor sp.]